MQLRNFLGLIFISCCLLLSGCGQSGPLYLPKQPPQATTKPAKQSVKQHVAKNQTSNYQ